MININLHWNKLKESLFETINKRFHIKDKAEKKELPKVFPLESFRIGRWSSYYQIQNQLYVVIDNDKFIFFVINPERRIETEHDTKMQLITKTLKKLLDLSNYFILETENQELGYSGTIAFEARYDELYGMEFTNSLLEDSCRIVTE